MSGTLYATLYVSVIAVLFIIASIIGVAQFWHFCARMLSHYGEYVMERFGERPKASEGLANWRRWLYHAHKAIPKPSQSNVTTAL
jgi:hypothetical protein